MIPAHFLAIAIGLCLDQLIGDPPNWPHPVRWIGQFISKMTAVLNKGRFRTGKGAVLLFLTVSITFITVFIIVLLSYDVHIFIGIAVEGVLIAIGLAQKSLRDAAMAVHDPLAEGNLKEARHKLSHIVGRDTDRLNEREITRATVETVSENTADGITSPLFWAFLFGAPGLWVYKAVNTLDSMVGYRDERYTQFGKFSARTDDVMNFIPARITGLLVICFAPNRGGLPFSKRLAGWIRDARKHPSPNSGYMEAATAWQLGVQLGGVSSYRGIQSERSKLGPGITVLHKGHIKNAIFEMHVTTFFFWFLFTMIGVFIHAFT